MTEPGPPAAGGRSPGSARSADAAAAWLGALEALAGRIGHDLRNALNGVAVNLEVVRGRSARGAEASAIAPFAATAAAQFEAASAAAEALLALTRAEPGAPDLVVIAQRLAQVLGVRDGAVLQVTLAPSGGARVGVPYEVARALLARSVLAALSASPTAACEIVAADDIFVRVTGAPDASLPLDPELVTIASTHGVGIAPGGAALELRFPALRSDASRYAPA